MSLEVVLIQIKELNFGDKCRSPKEGGCGGGVGVKIYLVQNPIEILDFEGLDEEYCCKLEIFILTLSKMADCQS